MVKSKGDVLFNILVYVIIFTVGLICQTMFICC